MAGPHLHDQLAAERDRINNGEAEQCGAQQDGLTCVRARHPHEPRNVVPHLGTQEQDDGTYRLVQWIDPAVSEAERPPGHLPGQPKQRPTPGDVQRQLAHDIATGKR
jgi:hypothetical protein